MARFSELDENDITDGRRCQDRAPTRFPVQREARRDDGPGKTAGIDSEWDI